jgi:hypothetical protein
MSETTVTDQQLEQLKSLTERAVDARITALNTGEAPTLKVTKSEILAVVAYMELEYCGCKLEIESEG